MDRLDPGISKRPSRFDRKYLFDIPTKVERVQYCEFWRAKLGRNPKVQFPQRLCTAIADITENFTFAYLKEAFIAALLMLAGKQDPAFVGKSNGGSKSELDDLPLWIEIRKQVENLKKELGAGSGGTLSNTSQRDKMSQIKYRSCFRGFFG